jgi:unsaturated rhamnogalacturonyl hydrolase
VAALARDAGADGTLLVSSATPVGDRATYVERPLGVFPWGQGPLVLTFVEARRATSGRTA